MTAFIAVCAALSKPLASARHTRQVADMALSARLVALLIFATAAVSLRLQFDASEALLGGATLGQTLWAMAAFFTILTNLGVALSMMAVAWRWEMPANFAAGLTLSIVVVSLVYHLILAKLWNPQGSAFWADQGLHTVVPALTVLWWAFFAPKNLTMHDVPKWLIWPAAYVSFAMIRGHLTGFYPYPFLDLTANGWPRTALNITGLTALFTALGFGLLALARISPR